MAAVRDTVVGDDTPKAQDSNDYSDLLHTIHSDAFAFSHQEQSALDLYDQLRELELQRSLLEAQNEVEEPDVSALSDDVLQEQLIIAEREAMEAKAEYELRNRVTHNVLSMDPVLKAVHGGERTDFAEKRMLPIVAENDVVSMVHGYLASKLTSTTAALGTAEEENIAANERNKKLSRTLLELAEEIKAISTNKIDDPRLREKVEAVEKGVKASRRRLRTLQGILSGMIVGSGINWAEDEVLRELVMEDEEDG